MPAAAEPQPTVVGSLRAAGTMEGPRTDPGSFLGGSLDTNLTPAVRVDAWLDGLRQIASCPVALQPPGDAETLCTVTPPSG